MQDWYGYVFSDRDAILGRGRHCVVKLATSTRYEPPRKVAIKIATLTPSSTKEAEILFKVNHEHIVEILDYFVNEGNACIVLAVAERGHLRNFVRRRGRLGADLAGRMCRQIFDAVAYLHDAVSVAHCDLKCENILVDANDNIKIIDFGFAMELEDISKDINERQSDRISRSSNESDTETDSVDNDDGDFPASFLTVVGSPAYAAPEVLDAHASDLRAADVWSAGVVVFFILTAYLPFGCQGNKAIREAMNAPLRWPRPLKQIPKPSRLFVKSALTLEPSERPTSRELHRRLLSTRSDEKQYLGELT